MATYLQGVTDTGFNSVNTTPNLPYMMNALQKVTARYEKNYNDLSNQYSKITDSLLLNPENNEFRAKFLENSKTALKTLSTTDLSVQNNIDQAEQIFSPFWEDKDLLADYSKSKLYQQQVERHNALRSSDKKEDREQAWDMGLAYVQLTAKEMALAKRGDGSIQNIEVRPYIPYKNLNKELFEELKNLGFENGVITKTYAGNGYIKTITNGKGTKALYDDVLQKIFSNRLDLKEIFKVEGTVNFESTVFDEMKKNPSLSRAEVEYNVKKGFATKQITDFDKKLYNINEQLDGTKEYKGLTRDIAETETSIYDRIKTGALKLESDEAKSFFEKLNKRDELVRVKSLYEEKINSLKSNDFYNTKGEDYFTDMFMSKFIDDSSSIREAAISEKMTSDATYVAAMSLNERIKEYNEKQNEKENKAQEKENAAGGTLSVENGKIVITPNSEDKKVKAKERTQSELLDVPDVAQDYSSNAKDLETSSFYNYVENKYNYGKMATDAASTYLNKNSRIQSAKIPNIDKYINYLNHYAHGGKPTTEFEPKDIEAAYKALHDKGIIKVSKYSENAPLQLNQLIEYADNADKTNITYESVVARSNYDLFSKYYVEADNIEKEFNRDNSTKEPAANLKNYVEKNKNNEWQFITAEGMLKNFNKAEIAGKVFSNIYGVNIKPNYPPAKLLQQYYFGNLELKHRDIQKKDPYDKGFITVRRDEFIVDPTTKKEYLLTDFLRKYGTKETVAAKRKEYEKDKGIRFNKFVSPKGEYGSKDWIMSKTLIYTNDPDDLVRDRSSKIAFDAISENKGNLIEKSGGIIKPVNYEELIKEGSSDEMKKVLKLLFNNQKTLDRCVSNTMLTYQGRNNESSNVKIQFDSQKLKDALASVGYKMTEGTGSSSSTVINSLATNGIEFNIKKDTFRRFAKDDYMQSSVKNSLLRGGGITATKYEIDNFYYDYTLKLGANDKMILTYKIKSYDPVLEDYKEGEEQILEYPINIGIDNILKDLREVGVANGIEINKFFKTKTENEQRKKAIEEKQKQVNNAPYTQQPGETLENFKKRIELEGKKMHKS